MTPAKLSEATVRQLAVPESGNRVTYFAGSRIQGVTAPRGFGVRQWLRTWAGVGWKYGRWAEANWRWCECTGADLFG